MPSVSTHFPIYGMVVYFKGFSSTSCTTDYLIGYVSDPQELLLWFRSYDSRNHHNNIRYNSK